MAYSNDQNEIRSGLVNYIGALLKSSNYKDNVGKQTVASILTEETLKLAQNEEGIFNLYVLKPMIRGVIIIFKQRIVELSKLPKSEQISSKIEEYQHIISSLEELVNMIQYI